MKLRRSIWAQHRKLENSKFENEMSSDTAYCHCFNALSVSQLMHSWSAHLFSVCVIHQFSLYWTSLWSVHFTCIYIHEKTWFCGLLTGQTQTWLCSYRQINIYIYIYFRTLTIEMFFMFPRLRHRKPDTIMNTCLMIFMFKIYNFRWFENIWKFLPGFPAIFQDANSE